MKTYVAEVELTQRCMAVITEGKRVLEVLTVLDSKKPKVIKREYEYIK